MNMILNSYTKAFGKICSHVMLFEEKTQTYYHVYNIENSAIVKMNVKDVNSTTPKSKKITGKKAELIVLIAKSLIEA